MVRDICLPLGSFGFVRPLQVADINAAYLDALNDADLTVFLETKGRRFVQDDLITYVHQNQQDLRALLLGVFSPEGMLVGTSRIHDIAPDGTDCWIGIFLFHRPGMGQGLGSRVVRAVSDYMLTNGTVAVVKAGIINGNDASRGCFRKAGFTLLEEGQPYHGRVREVWGRSLADA